MFTLGINQFRIPASAANSALSAYNASVNSAVLQGCAVILQYKQCKIMLTKRQITGVYAMISTIYWHDVLSFEITRMYTLVCMTPNN